MAAHFSTEKPDSVGKIVEYVSCLKSHKIFLPDREVVVLLELGLVAAAKNLLVSVHFLHYDN